MHQVRRSAFLWLTIAITTLLALCNGCGGSNGTSGPPPVTTLTAAQATAVATQLEGTFVAASALMGSGLCPTPPSSSPGAEDYCAISVATSVPCSDGGLAAISGLLTGDVSFTDTGTFTGPLTLTPTSCSIPGSALVFNGYPNLTVSGAINFFYGEVTSFAVTEAGSISYGPKSTEVCPVNLTIAASFVGNAEHTTKSCTLTGTACGQTINQSCM